MNHSMLRSVRTPSILIQKPDVELHTEYWEVSLSGLHPEDMKSTVHDLRKARQKNGDSISQQSQLKIKSLLDNSALALGGKSFENWIHQVQPNLDRFFDVHGLHVPADLITWEHPPFAHSLTPRQIADRLFASGLPLPEKLFTGVGNQMFAARGYGALDLQWAIARLSGVRDHCSRSDLEQVRFVSSLPDEQVFTENLLDDEITVDPVYAKLTLHDLLLLTFRWDLDCCFNLLGDNLVLPKSSAPVYQLYNTEPDDEQRMEALFQLFRARIEQTTVGWVDVLPFNENLIFLRGPDGAFDWVVRDQRNAPFSGNKLHPIFFADEIPVALSAGTEMKAKLHFTKGLWLDKIEHLSEQHYYATGGTVATYPGPDQVLTKYLIAINESVPRKMKAGPRHVDFVAHALADKCLMVSELITIDEFWNFYDADWADRRDAKAARTARSWPPLAEMNGRDERDRPVCITWYDAVAYCKYLERRTGIPARLLTIEEWQAIAPARAAVQALGASATKSVVEGLDLAGNVLKPPTYLPHYFTRFTQELCWAQNREGLSFLSSLSFGEWLADYQGSAPNSVFAPVACTASGIALGRGPLERELFEAWYVGRNNHLKIGFRVCYVATHDS
jgi:hypothetical protein